MKLINRKTVYQMVAKRRTLSRTDVAQETDISSPTIMKIMRFLELQELIAPCGSAVSALGRKPQLYSFCPDRYVAMGIVMEGEYLHIGIVNLAGEIITKNSTKIVPMPDESFMPAIISEIKNVLNMPMAKKERLLGIGFGVPGMYDSETKVIATAPLIGIHEPFDTNDMINELIKEFGVPVVLGNDVNMEVLGEYRFAQYPEEDLLYLSIGTGVGAGLVLNNALRRGSHDCAGEVGYMRFGMGQGTRPFEYEVNLQALREKYNFDTPDWREENKGDLIKELSNNIALCINNSLFLLDMERVVLGGVVTDELGEEFVKAVADKVRRQSLFHVKVGLHTADYPGIIGSAMEVIDIKLDEILSMDDME